MLSSTRNLVRTPGPSEWRFWGFVLQYVPSDLRDELALRQHPIRVRGKQVRPLGKIDEQDLASALDLQPYRPELATVQVSVQLLSEREELSEVLSAVLQLEDLAELLLATCVLPPEIPAAQLTASRG